MERCLVLLQIDMSCFVNIHRRTAIFSLEKEEEWIRGLTERKGEGFGREKGGKTVARIGNIAISKTQ